MNSISRRPRRGGRVGGGRPKKTERPVKSAADLDAEMEVRCSAVILGHFLIDASRTTRRTMHPLPLLEQYDL